MGQIWVIFGHWSLASLNSFLAAKHRRISRRKVRSCRVTDLIIAIAKENVDGEPARVEG
jgi:hypothetical protein